MVHLVTKDHISPKSIAKGSLSPSADTPGKGVLPGTKAPAAAALLFWYLLDLPLPAPLLVVDFFRLVENRSEGKTGTVSWGCCPETRDEVADLFDCGVHDKENESNREI
jgi:hypothetical protein